MNIYTRRQTGDGETTLGSQIGVGFAHGSGGGFTICLDAMPIPSDGRLDLVAFPIKTKRSDHQDN
ncbi:hypothetical protein CLV84_4297 [Neolewinella xylanilytica]|uniref:Uncharacterized protein n=1 Tax=Neolewinella xylanilytica TaxID=1514080 RepID=A0A2S6HZR5_9BACT|nr:hypothetical protein CLV84_4297 [Neolewinella xylanilytica]